MAAVFRTFEHSYYQYRLGNLSEQTWGAVDATVKSQLNSDGAKKLWRLRAETYDAEFRRYVDSVVGASDTLGANELLASLRDNDIN